MRKGFGKATGLPPSHGSISTRVDHVLGGMKKAPMVPSLAPPAAPMAPVAPAGPVGPMGPAGGAV